MYERLLVRYGDLNLKGKNKRVFIKCVNNNIKEKLKDYHVSFEFAHDRLYVLLNNENYEDIIKCLDKVPGLYSYSLVSKTTLEINNINELALKLAKQNLIEGKVVTFKVTTKRAYKAFPIHSMQMTQDISSYVLRNTENLKTDVHNPDFTLHIEIRETGTYIFTDQIYGMGGFPAGIAGKGLLMISGGIDSPVAGYLAMKQGVDLSCIHYESSPLTPIESAQKVIDICEKLSEFTPTEKIKLYLVPFKDIHETIITKLPSEYIINIMRRMMYRIADAVVRKDDFLTIINGESIGQVASQTLESMKVINSVTNIPVIRPLATYDKNDIIKVSRKIGTYDISIRPFQDCCTVYLPDSPVIRPTIEKAERIESMVDFAPLLEKCISEIKVITVTSKKHLDITNKGFTVKEALE